jgi:hypothetical protein
MLTVGGAISGYSAIGRKAQRDHSEDRDDHRDDGRKDGPVNEEMTEAHRTFGG